MRLIPLEGLSWSDERGWGLRPLQAAGVETTRVVDVHVVSIAPGAVRGNHRHPNVTEWMLLFGAPSTLAWREEGGAARSVSLRGDQPFLAEIPPGVVHAVRGDGPGTAFLVAWADGVPATEWEDPLL